MCPAWLIPVVKVHYDSVSSQPPTISSWQGAFWQQRFQKKPAAKFRPGDYESHQGADGDERAKQCKSESLRKLSEVNAAGGWNERCMTLPGKILQTKETAQPERPSLAGTMNGRKSARATAVKKSLHRGWSEGPNVLFAVTIQNALCTIRSAGRTSPEA